MSTGTGTIRCRPRGARPTGDRNIARRACDVSPRYAVFGYPIAHSLSPRIHAMFAAQCGIALEYRAIEAGREAFADVLAGFARAGGRGANVTLPLKQDALGVCATLSDRARRCGSVNTLLRVADTWHGDSTDGAGLLRDLRDHHDFDPRGRRILLLGAGGAARAVAFAFADAGAARLTIANRKIQRAQALANAPGINATAVAWNAAAVHTHVDLLINATAVGHSGEMLDLPIGKLPGGTLCLDLSYGKAAQPFMAWAHANGARRVLDGLGMLVEQAADSFALWFGVRPDTHVVTTEFRVFQSAAR